MRIAILVGLFLIAMALGGEELKTRVSETVDALAWIFTFVAVLDAVDVFKGWK